MAEAQSISNAGEGSETKPIEGFADSFIDSETESPQKEPVIKKNRFSDDFSGLESPSHATMNGGTVMRAENWEQFDIVPDRSETPTNELSQDDEEEDHHSSLPDILTDPEKPKNGPEPVRVWESFDDDAIVRRRHTSEDVEARRRIKSNDDLEINSGPRIGVDAETNQSEWTALKDTFKKTPIQPLEDSLPFRRTQSLRADSHRAVRIVDALKQQRRLSNSSLDRDPQRTMFVNEDELTRKFKMERQWDIYLKLNKRIPGTKTKWLPVKASVRDGVLSIKKGAIPATNKTDVIPAVVEDVVLQHNHCMTNPVPRVYDRRSKLHQVKLQQAVVQEKRTLKRLLLMEHVTTCNTLLKLGSHDLNIIQTFLEAINEAVRQLPVTRARGVAYRVNEVFVDVKESSDILMNCDGAVLDRKSLSRIYVQAFLTGAPECKLVLNDIEFTLMQGKSSLTQSMNRQVRLVDIVLHPCVNQELYTSSREIRFQPVDGSTFELLRCSIDPYISPPINLSCLMEYNQTQHSVKITSSFIVRKKHNLRQRPITNLIIKFPIPSSWSSLFLTESKFGTQRSIGSTASLRGSFRRKIKTRDCQIETHLGSARYELEHQAIMWRIGTYNTTTQPHTFECQITLKSGMQKPDMVNEKAEVTYTVPGTSNGLAVKGFQVEGSTAPETWVKYEIQYRYEVQMFPDLSID